jgi:hypothetical protein
MFSLTGHSGILLITVQDLPDMDTVPLAFRSEPWADPEPVHVKVKVSPT